MQFKLANSVKRYFDKKKEFRQFKKLSPEDVFTQIYRSNKWGDKESRSGKGSNLERTTEIRTQLPQILQSLGAQSMLDIPCGDFYWMKEIDLPLQEYTGADIVKPLIEENSRLYGNAFRQFVQLDLLQDTLPKSDVIFCRECLVHLSFENIFKAIENIKSSESGYLMVTQFPAHKQNKNIVTGKHRSLNMTLAPFNWPQPFIELMEYHAGSRRGNKCLAVWKIDELP
jgi:2-polyprenyl-3-methyl-5-hydroxy-6-metoxy-1,4-benzoquinol methylase